MAAKFSHFIRSHPYRLLVLLVLFGVLGSQLYFIPRTPWDWDEPVYTFVSRGVIERGYPVSFDPDLDGNPKFYPYHPPFHFMVLSAWYRVGGISVESGRVLSAVIYTALIGFLMWFVWVITGSKRTMLFAGTLYALDGWMKYSGLLVKIDTMSALIGAVGIFLFYVSWQGKSRSLAVLAGVMLGVATAYKHVGGIVLLAIPLHWLIVTRAEAVEQRRELKKRKNVPQYENEETLSGLQYWSNLIINGIRSIHGTAFFVALGVIVLYFMYMIVVVKQPFIDATLVQIRRTLGLQEARGLDYGLAEVIQALWQTYWSFGGTLIFLGFGVICTLYSLFQHVRGQAIWKTLFTAWSLAAIIVLVGIRLKNPHYLSHAIVPIHLVGILHLWLMWRGGKIARLFAFGFVLIVLLANIGTLGVRLFAFSNADALRETQLAINTKVPDTAIILADEPICASVRQECVRIGQFQDYASLRQFRPDIIVVYSSITQDPPTSPAILDILSNSDPIPGIPTFEDWKARIQILRIMPGFWENR